ncbi:MAG: prolipoprotein diacylglyceryl transferase family protein [Myxococcota bacterium]
MLPVIHFLGFKIPTFMAVMVVCYAVAFVWCVRWGIKQGIDRQDVFDGTIVGCITAVFGAKLGHVLFESTGHQLEGGHVATGILDLLKADPWHWARIEDPGYVWYGGALALVPVALWFTRSRGIDRGKAADAGAPALALGVALGRLGCFLGGCCYGRPTDVPWGVHFPHGEAAALGPVHPTQLYEAAVGVLMVLYVIWRFPRRKVEGELLATVTVVYALQRFLTEFFRGDAERGIHAGFGTSQLISIPVFVVGVGVLAWLWRHGTRVVSQQESPEPAPPSAPEAAA